MHPELFSWGPVHIRSYGLMLAIAFLVGTWIALREGRRLKLDEDRLLTVILAGLIGGVLGARLLYVLEHVDEFRREWGSVLALWQGGLTLYGGMVGGTVCGLVAARRLGMPGWLAADALTPSLALGTMFGRVGCYLNGCCYGRPTGHAWGITFPPDSFAGLEFGNALLHPAQLYFAAAGLLLFLLAWWARTRIRTPGVLFWSFLIAFALIRIPLDLTRAYEPSARALTIGAAQLTESQITSVALALFGALMVLRLRRAARG